MMLGELGNTEAEVKGMRVKGEKGKR